MKPIEDRFIVMVDRGESPCWNWLGHVMPNGYGQFRWPGGSLAHRYAYTLWIGPIPDGMVIDHLCRNRKCVNPSHLRAISQGDNIRAGVRKTQQTECRNGHPLTGDNLKPTASGRRQCRACQVEANRRYRLRRVSVSAIQPNP